MRDRRRTSDRAAGASPEDAEARSPGPATTDEGAGGEGAESAEGRAREGRGRGGANAQRVRGLRTIATHRAFLRNPDRWPGSRNSPRLKRFKDSHRNPARPDRQTRHKP